MRLPIHLLPGSGINAPDMRSVNAIQLLNLLREHGPVSRAGLARLSGLSKPAVSEQVNRLAALGMVLETGIGDACESGGKRPTMLAFHADSGRVAGIDVGPDIVRIALSDLQGRFRDHVTLPTIPESSPRKLVGRSIRALATLVARSGKSLHAVGIGVPGRVDCKAGMVLESGGVFGWRDVDLRTPFEQRFGCPVSIDNDVKVRLMAELHRGAAKSSQTAVLIHVDAGVGSAVAIERIVHHGSHWAAGEIGHLAAGGCAATCLNPREHVESILGADQVARRIRAASRTSGTLRKLLRNMTELEALTTAAAQSDGTARALAAELSAVAAVAVVNQALAYDPDVVLLSGALLAAFMDDIRRALTRTAHWSTNLRMAELQDNAVQAGAVDMALMAAYEQMARSVHGYAPVKRAAAGA